MSIWGIMGPGNVLKISNEKGREGVVERKECGFFKLDAGEDGEGEGVFVCMCLCGRVCLMGRKREKKNLVVGEKGEKGGGCGGERLFSGRGYERKSALQKAAFMFHVHLTNEV